MAILNQHQLELERCPHCNVDRPNLTNVTQAETKDHTGANKQCWRFYCCTRCGGIVTAAARNWDQEVTQLYPSGMVVDDAIPERARSYLSQALTSLSAPAGAVMLAASAVDAMLKVKGYRDGSLYSRIDRAVTDNLITADMGKWAHQVRLDATESSQIE